MKKLLTMTMIAATALIVACNQKNETTPMEIGLGTNVVKIEGSRANHVKADTASLMIARDSVANEETDTVFDIHTSLTLILDTTFQADKMEEVLSLLIQDSKGSALATLSPTADALPDSLIAFLNKNPGESITISFAGKINRSTFLRLSSAKNVILRGFSFQELDPESMADPKITQKLNSIEEGIKWCNEYLDECLKEKAWPGNRFCVETMEEIEDVVSMQKIMSPKQLERFNSLRKYFDKMYDRIDVVKAEATE